MLVAVKIGGLLTVVWRDVGVVLLVVGGGKGGDLLY